MGNKPTEKISFIDYFKKNLTDTFLFLVGFLLVYPLGFRSLMALDQNIVFEAGARISQGQQPFSDFYLPFGLTPAYLQAILFRIFGIQWKIYVLHACIINGFTAVVIYRMMRLLTSYPISICFFVSFYTTLVFYTLPATPYADNHAQFFCLLGLYTFLLAMYKKSSYLFWVPLCFLFAFFSKQNPTFFYLILMIGLGIFNYSFIRKNIRWFLLSWIPVLFLVVYFVLKWRHTESIFYYQWTLPSGIGSKRFSSFNLYSFKEYFQLSFDGAKYLILLLPLSIYFLIKQKTNSKRWNQVMVGSGVFFITLLSAFVTMNQQQNAYAFLTPALFILLAPIYLFFETWKKPFGIITCLVFIACSLILIRPKTDFIVYRGFNDVDYSYKNEPTSYNKNLDIYLQQLCPMATNAEYDSVMVFLKNSDKNFIWFGDASFIGSILGNSSPNPLIFYHLGLSYPDPKNDPKEFKILQTETFIHMEEKNTTYLMIEAEKLFMGSDFHEFWDPVLPYCTVVKRFGSSKIYQIDERFYSDWSLRKR